MSVYIENFEIINGIKNNIQASRNKVLELAIQGKLVPQDPNDEPASKLVRKIKAERDRLVNEGNIKKQQTLKPIGEEEKPFEIPESWEWMRLNELADFIDYRGKTPQKTSEGISLITAKNIKWGYLDASPHEYIAASDYEKWMTRGIPSYGNIVFTTEAPLANVARLFLKDKYALAQRAIAFNTHINLVDAYLLFALMSDSIRKMIYAMATGTTVLGIKASKLKELIIPIPPLAEQHRIVAKVESLMAEIDKLEEALQKKEHLMKLLPKAVVDAIGKCQTVDELKKQLQFVVENFEIIFQTPNSMQELRKVILQLAIEGKLVPQDPNDEPASVLVERIKAERDKLVEQGKIKKQQPLKPIEENEIPFEIPESWEWVRLYSIADINPRNMLEDDLEVSFIPMKLIDDGYGSSHASEKKKWKDLKSGYTHFAENDIAVAKITPCFENRKSAILAGLKSGYGAGTTELHIIRPFSDLLSRWYLLYLFKTQWFIDSGVKTFSGTAGQQRVGTDYIKEYIVPLPSQKEQVKIVKKVQSIMGLIDLMEIAMKNKVELIERMANNYQNSRT